MLYNVLLVSAGEQHKLAIIIYIYTFIIYIDINIYIYIYIFPISLEFPFYLPSSHPLNGTDEPICRTGIEMQTYRRDLWTQGEEGEGGVHSESITDIYTLPSVK